MRANDKMPRGAVAINPPGHRRLGHMALVAVGILVAGASIVAGEGARGLLGALLALVMLVIAVVDARRFLIPDSLNATGLALGLANAALLARGDGAVLIEAALRAAVAAGILMALRQAYARLRGRQGIGLGDVKLAAVAGVWLDWQILPIAIEIAALSAIAMYALRRHVLHHALKPTSRLPFGLFFAPAIWIGWLLQTMLMRGWWL